MIVYHKNDEIDREQWDNCIRNSGCLKPFPYSWYLDIMSPGWEALVDDDYDSVFPMPLFSRLGFTFIENPVFLQQLGVFSPDKPEEQALSEFLSFIPDFYRFIDLDIALKPSNHGFRITEKNSYILDLSKSYEELYENFTENCRRNIEKSLKKNNEIVEDITPDELLDMFILNNGKGIKGIRAKDYVRLKKLMNFCIINKKGKIIGTRSGHKKPSSGMFIINLKGSMTMLLSADTQHSVERKSGYFICNELIKSNSRSRSVLDFAEPVLYGIPDFYLSFGVSKVPYYKIYRNRMLWPAGLIRLLK